jgi:hypothetical protein
MNIENTQKNTNNKQQTKMQGSFWILKFEHLKTLLEEFFGNLEMA